MIINFDFPLKEVIINSKFLIIISLIILKHNFLNILLFLFQTEALKALVNGKQDLILEALLLHIERLDNFVLIEALHLELLGLEQQSLGPFLTDL